MQFSSLCRFNTVQSTVFILKSESLVKRKLLCDLHPHSLSVPVVAGLLAGGQGSGILPGERVHCRLAAHAGDYNSETKCNKLQLN